MALMVRPSGIGRIPEAVLPDLWQVRMCAYDASPFEMAFVAILMDSA